MYKTGDILKSIKNIIHDKSSKSSYVYIHEGYIFKIVNIINYGTLIIHLLDFKNNDVKEIFVSDLENFIKLE
jgi:hypothetical protein